MNGGGSLWKPSPQVRAALSRGDQRFAAYRRKLAEWASAERREARARRAGT